MAFSAIDPTTPAGTDKIKFGDDRIREFKLQTIANLQEVSNYPATAAPALRTAVWTTATRPSGAELVDRVSGYNTDLSCDEYYDLETTSWKAKAEPASHETDTTAHPAANIVNTPAGSIAATTVQDAINELDTEKAALAGAAFTGAVTVQDAAASNQPVALGQFVASASNHGYCKLPNGIIIQWGVTAGHSTVTFPIPFPNAVWSVQATPAGGGNPVSATVDNVSRSAFSCNSSYTCYWLAVGG